MSQKDEKQKNRINRKKKNWKYRKKIERSKQNLETKTKMESCAHKSKRWRYDYGGIANDRFPEASEKNRAPRCYSSDSYSINYDNWQLHL